LSRESDENAGNSQRSRGCSILDERRHPPKVIFVPAFPRLAENNIRQGFLEDAQYEKLLESCLELWFQTVVELGATYGWRISELKKLRVNQIELENWTIRLHPDTTKNKEGREVKMTKIVHALLTLCVEGKGPDAYALSWPNWKPVKDCRGTWEKACKAAGFPICSFTTSAGQQQGTIGEPPLLRARS